MKSHFIAASSIIIVLCSEAFAFDVKAKSAVVCPSGQHWVRAFHRNAYSRSDGTHVSATDVSAHCQDNPPSYAKWRDRLKSGGDLPAWAKKEKIKSWTDEELERVFDALSEIPSIILADSVKSIYRSQKSSQYEKNPAGGDSSYIVLYDPAFDSNANLTRILAHEFAHEAFRQIPNDLRRKYADAAGWILEEDGQSYRAGRLDYVEEDGPTSMTEDFSNNIEYFIFDRKKLQKTAPRVDSWIQKMFGDKLKLEKGPK